MSRIPALSLSDPDVEPDTPVFGQTTYRYTMTCDPDPPGIFPVPALVRYGHGGSSNAQPGRVPFVQPLPALLRVDRRVSGTELIVAGDGWLQAQAEFSSETVFFQVRGQLYTGFVNALDARPPLRVRFIAPELDAAVAAGDAVVAFDVRQQHPMQVPCWFDPDIEVGFNGDSLYEGIDPDTFETIVEFHIVQGFPRVAAGGLDVVSLAPIPIKPPPGDLGGLLADSFQTPTSTFDPNTGTRVTNIAAQPLGLFPQAVSQGGWFVWGDDDDMANLPTPPERIDRLHLGQIAPAGLQPGLPSGRLGSLVNAGPVGVTGAAYLAPYFRVQRRRADYAGQDFPGWLLSL